MEQVGSPKFDSLSSLSFFILLLCEEVALLNGKRANLAQKDLVLSIISAKCW